MCLELQHRCHSPSYAGRHLSGCSQNKGEKKSTMCTTSKISLCSTRRRKDSQLEKTLRWPFSRRLLCVLPRCRAGRDLPSLLFHQRHAARNILSYSVPARNLEIWFLWTLWFGLFGAEDGFGVVCCAPNKTKEPCHASRSEFPVLCSSEVRLLCCVFVHK